MNVVVTGSIAYDYVMSFPGRFAEHILHDQIHRLSVSFLVDDMRKQRRDARRTLPTTCPCWESDLD